METLIIGLIFNLYTWDNADFFCTNEKITKENIPCVWVDKGWSKADPKNPSLHIFGYTKYKQQCISKDK